MINPCLVFWSKWESFGYIFIIMNFIPYWLPYWFCNKFGFGDFDGFAKLEDQRVVSSFLILRETWATFDKNLLRRLEMWTHEKYVWFLHNGYHNHRWLSYLFLKPCRSKFDIIIVDYHLKLIRGCTSLVWIQPYSI